MAGPWYVDSAAGGTNAGTSANPWASLASVTAGNGVAAGDTIYISDRHAESSASALAIALPGTIAAPNTLLCTDHTKWPSPGSGDLKTSATVTTTGNSAITISGSSYWYGVQFSAGTGAVTAKLNLANSAGIYTYEQCKLIKAGSSGAAAAIGANAVSAQLILIGTTMQFSAAGDGFSGGGYTLWKNTPSAIVAGTIPTTLFTAGTEQYDIQGVDLSGTTNTIFGSNAGFTYGRLLNCKLAGGVTISATPSLAGAIIDVVNSDSGATNYRHERYSYQATQIVEPSVVRTGGASDGATPISWKITTTANSKFLNPYLSMPIAIWNTKAGGNVVVTIDGTWNQNAVPNNDDIWIEAEYFGDGGSPLGSFANSTKANFLASGVALPADGSAWGGGGSGAGWSPFSMSVTLSAPQPQLVGYIYVTVKAAKASSVFYIDPLIQLS